jgi:putative hemolysin
VHPDYRNGAVIMSLWGGLAAYMKQNGYETMLGCASVGMIDGGHYAANLYCSLQGDSLTAPEYRAFPHTPLPVEELRTGAEVSPPPLVKGYLRLGAPISSRCSAFPTSTLATHAISWDDRRWKTLLRSHAARSPIFSQSSV